MNKIHLSCAGLALIAAAALPMTAMAKGLDSMPDAKNLPSGTAKVSAVVPQMGEHWANPKQLPLGPIYCVYKGKVVCLEYMISQADFASGKSWPALVGAKGLPPVDHTSIAFEPHGHEGFTVPHYDIHMFFISSEEVKRIK